MNLSTEDLKKQCRKQLRAARDRIGPLKRQESSAQACTSLKFLLENHRFVLSFPSFGSEIDLWPLNQELSNQGRLVLPRLSGLELHLYQVDNPAI